jgi:hypothetical protein
MREPREVADPESGSTFIEIMIGVVVMSAALLGMLNVTLQSSRQRRTIEESGFAYLACRENLEQLRALPITSLPALHGTGFDVPGPDGAPGFLHTRVGDPDGLPGRIEVVLDKQTPVTKLYRVALVVEWERMRGEQQVRIDTLVGERR